jgi:hypothetical protein
LRTAAVLDLPRLGDDAMVNIGPELDLCLTQRFQIEGVTKCRSGSEQLTAATRDHRRRFPSSSIFEQHLYCHLLDDEDNLLGMDVNPQNIEKSKLKSSRIKGKLLA